MSDTVAHLDSVGHRYGDVTALEPTTLALPAGCMIGLIGPDGVGKSTLLSLLAGVRKIQTGTIRLFEGDLKQPSFRRQVCPRIAYMPQGLGRNLYMTLTVAENIDFFARLLIRTGAFARHALTICCTAPVWLPFAIDRQASYPVA